MSELPVYDPSEGERDFIPAQTVVIAGKPRERIAWCYPGIVEHYRHWDRVEGGRRYRSQFGEAGDGET